VQGVFDMKNPTQAGSQLIDLSSDAVTVPTETMWRAMESAPLGMASMGIDRSVNMLEELAAQLMGKEAAVFVATGTLANLLALLSHANRGDQVILNDYAHILWCEEWGIAEVCSLLPRPISGSGGSLDPVELEKAITQRHYSHVPRTGLVCLENTFDAGGGTIVTPAETRATCEVAHSHNVPVHLDGCRVFNAAVALGIDVGMLVEPVDSVMFSLCKGLSAPMGSLLCGSRAFVEKARHHRRVLGTGSIHKLGIAASAGLVALDTMVDRLSEDNRRARMLAEGLANVEGLQVDLERVQTNIVAVEVTASNCSGMVCQAELEKHGVRTHLRSSSVIRLVTHRHIGDVDVESAVEAFRRVMG
jgi:threonine aldolase